MPVQIKMLQKSEVEISAEISAEDFERAYQKTLRKYNQNANIPGFRPGYVPENILIEKIGANALLEDAAETALADAYPKIIEENKIRAIGRPKIAITKMARNNPLGFKAVTAVMPEINLPDYKKIALELTAQKETIAVEEKEIGEAIEHLRRSARKKDSQTGDGEKNLPEINDEFAKQFGQPDTASLKNVLYANILEDKKIKAREKKRMEIIEKISSLTEMDIPEAIIEAEKNKMLLELKNSIESMAFKWTDYLSHLKKTEEDLQKEWRPEAEKRARYGMILNEIANAEKIEPQSGEIDNFAEKILSQRRENERQKIDKERLKDYAYGIMRNEKVFQLLEAQN